MGLVKRLADYRGASARAMAGVAALGGVAMTSLDANPAKAQDQTPSYQPVSKKDAWKTSKANGGTLVIWYDARHQWDAERLVLTLKDMDKQNVVALPGRTDGMFQLMAGGKIDRHLYDLNDARSGLLGATAIDFANERNIS